MPTLPSEEFEFTTPHPQLAHIFGNSYQDSNKMTLGQVPAGLPNPQNPLVTMKIHYVSLKKDAQYSGRPPKILDLGVQRSESGTLLWDPAVKTKREWIL